MRRAVLLQGLDARNSHVPAWALGASLLIGVGARAPQAAAQCVTFAAPVSYPAGLMPDSIATSDLDGDGDLDLVATDSLTNLVYLFFNDGKGSFPITTPLSGIPRHANSISISDLDNDGNDDLIVGYGASNPGFGNFPLAGLAVYTGLGNGLFQEPKLYDAGGPVVSTEIGDMDNDGDLDVLGANEGGNAYTLFFNNGKFPSLTPLNATHPIDPNFINGFDETSIVLAPFASDLPLLVDLDLDGDLDIAVGNGFFSVVTLLYNDGEGGFSPQDSLVISVDGFSVHRIAAGDLNGDDRVDLVLAESTFAAQTLLNTGDRTYDLLPSIGGFSNSTDIHLVDFTNDGVLDALTVNLDLNEFRILPGLGGGIFGASQLFPSGLGPYQAVIGDFNGDGAPDVAAVNIFGSGDISVHLNTGLALQSSDLNDDGRTNGVDLAQLLQTWGECENGFPCAADLNCDQQVNALDLATLLTNWQPSL